MGASDYSMRIWVKPDRLAKLGITIPEIVAAVREQNVIAPGGKFGAEPAAPGTEFTYTVRLPDRLVSEEEFGNVVIRSESDGSQVLIKDVARVELGVESYNAFTRLNQNECAIIALYQSPGSNAVALSETVRKTMDELAENFPEGIEYKVSLDSTAPIKPGDHVLVMSNGGFGGFHFYSRLARYIDSYSRYSSFTDCRIYGFSHAGFFH